MNKKLIVVIITIIFVIAIVSFAYYYDDTVKGTFSVTINGKNVASLVNPNLPVNTFEAGESFELNIWVQGNTNPFLVNTINLVANDGSVPITMNQNADIGHDGITYSFSQSYGLIHGEFTSSYSPSNEFSSILTVMTSTTTPAGYYTVTVLGQDNSGITHQDSYSFSIVN